MTDPVIPRMRILTFDDDAFTWERFENFCLAVVRAQPSVKRAERYGKTGEKQKGIDIEADLDDGRKRTLQCRHRKRFTKANAEKTVRETTYTTDEHEIWATCAIGAATSDYVDGLDGWSLHSAEGISQTVRALPREVARRIVDDAFGPQVRRAFLGPDGPVAFETTADFFEPLDEPGRLLRHDLPLIGREGALAALVAALDEPAVRVVVLPGRGGIGKTRLVRAAAEASPERVLFARAGADLTADAVDDLPFEPILVVVDDAHLEDVMLGPLLAAALRRREPVKVLLTVRPAGVERVRSISAQTGLDSSQVAVLPALSSLAMPDVEALAAEALGSTGPQASRLADATADTPLITTMGGRLLARGSLGPPDATDAELRQAVLSRFVDEQLGQVSPKVPAEAARQLATMVAALAPVDLADDPLITGLGSELGVAASRVRRWLSELQAAGLLLARGELRRLTPDVLADELVYEACVDVSGHPTGYADELWQRFAPVAAESLLANLAQLDWRLAPDDTSVLDDVWGALEETFRAADAYGRRRILSLAGRAAFAAPERTLRLSRLAVDNVELRDTLIPLLRAAGQHPAHAPAVMEMLWELARDDARPANQHPDHPLRVLEGLAGYNHTPAHHDALLDVVERRLGDDHVDDHVHLPLSLLTTLLTREGTTQRAAGFSIEMGSYNVSAEATQIWRERIRALLVNETLRGSARRRSAAASMFGDALELPHGYFGNTPTAAAVEQWREDQAALLDAIAEIEENSHDAAVRTALAQALRLHAEGEPWPEIQARATDLLARLQGADEELVEAITDPWGLHDPDRKTERDERVAARLLTAHQDPESFAQALEHVMTDIAGRDAIPEPGAVLSFAYRTSASHARGCLRWSLEHPGSHLATHIWVALDELRRAGQAVAEELAQTWESEDLVLRRNAAAYLSAGAWFQAPEPSEISMLQEALNDPDPFIARAISTALLRLRAVDQALAARLAVRILIAEHPDADMVFATIHDAAVSTLDAEQLDHLIEQLASVRDLGHFGTHVIAGLDADRMLAVWRRRLDHPGGAEYRAVPYHDFGADTLGGDPVERRRVLATLLAGGESLSSQGLRNLGRLFWRFAIPGLSDTNIEAGDILAARNDQISDALAVAETWLIAPGTPVNAATTVIWQIPWQLLMDRHAWVHDVLEHADPDRRDQLASAFHTAAFAGSDTRTLGEASPRRSATEVTASRVAAALPAGSVAQRLYDAIAAACRREIEDQRRQDEEEQSGWS